MNEIRQKAYIRRCYRSQLWLRCAAAVVLVVTSGLAPLSHAAQRLAKAAASSEAPAYLQLERLDEKALRTLRGEGGVDASPLPINLGIILWDEPGHGGPKPNALVDYNSGDAMRGSVSGHYESYQSVSVSRQ